MDANPAFEVALSATVATDPKTAFDAFTQPEHVSRWFTTRHEADVRVGGSYRNADGDRGEFLRVTSPDLVQFTWDNASHCPGTSVTVTFAATGSGRTAVELRHDRLGSERDAQDMKGGWSWALASFKSYVETGAPIRHEDWLDSQPGGGRPEAEASGP